MLQVKLLIVVASFWLMANAGEYITIDGMKYYVSHPITRNWFKSNQFCATLGLYLVDIRTELEFNRFSAVVNQYNSIRNGTDEIFYWTSGTDKGGEGDFYWFGTGQQVHFSQWRDTQPDNYQNLVTNETDDCLVVKGSTLEWEDEYCTNTYSFICRDSIDVPQYSKAGCSSYSNDM